MSHSVHESFTSCVKVRNFFHVSLRIVMFIDESVKQFGIEFHFNKILVFKLLGEVM